MQEHNDTELIALSIDGNHAAYAELVDRYKNALYRHCFAIVRDEDEAEDIAQEAFVTAYYKLQTFDPTYKFATWLFKIATNKAMTWLKKSSREPNASDEMVGRLISALPSAEQEFQRREVERAVDTLKPKYRVVVRLYYWEGMKYSEIATVLAVSEGTIKSWLSRAKTQLKKELS